MTQIMLSERLKMTAPEGKEHLPSPPLRERHLRRGKGLAFIGTIISSHPIFWVLFACFIFGVYVFTMLGTEFKTSHTLSDLFLLYSIEDTVVKWIIYLLKHGMDYKIQDCKFKAGLSGNLSSYQSLFWCVCVH